MRIQSSIWSYAHDVKVLGVDLAVLGHVEVLLRDENALCGDRVSACPCMQQSRENV
jgi:hypothetical protein